MTQKYREKVAANPYYRVNTDTTVRSTRFDPNLAARTLGGPKALTLPLSKFAPHVPLQCPVMVGSPSFVIFFTLACAPGWCGEDYAWP